MLADTARWGLAVAMAVTVAQAESLDYSDARRGFRFTYPAEFGTTSAGTDDGFEDRAATIRFAAFSSSGIGGEAALTRGAAVIDIQGAGGLYDWMTVGALPPAMRRQIVQALPPLGVSNFCQVIALEQHLDPQAPSFSNLTAQQKTALVSMDRMRNIEPRVHQCVVDGATVTFDKEVAFQPGFPRQHVYGAVRFLDAPFTTFQIVRAGPAPRASVLAQMTALVKSWSRM